MRVIAALLSLAVLLAAAPGATPQPLRSQLPGPAGARPQAQVIQGFSFPTRLGGLTRASTTDFEANSPGLGFSVKYRGAPPSRADIYVYDKKLSLPDRPADDSIAIAERAAALSDIEALVKRGSYQSATAPQLSMTRPASGGPAFAAASLRIAERGVISPSYVFVGVARGKFVKLRITLRDGPNADQQARAFVLEFARTLAAP